MKKTEYDRAKELLDKLEKIVNGGKGSGNFGHAGRPGEVGGSSSSGELIHATTSKEKKEEEYKAIIKEEATLKGAGRGRRSIEDIAKQFDKDPAEVEQDIDDYEVGGSSEITSGKTEKTNLKTVLETPGALEKLKSDINTRISEVKQKMKKSTKTEDFSDYTKFDNPDVKKVVKALGLSNISTYAQTVAVVQILQEKGLI